MPVLRKIEALPVYRPKKYQVDGTVHPDWKPRKSGRRIPKNRKSYFVAWDGEGINTGNRIPIAATLKNPHGKSKAKVDNPTYHDADEHIVTLLACSDGQIAYHLYKDNERLTSLELLQFIGDCVQRFGPLAIHVSFFFTYDASHILRDIPREEVEKAYTKSRPKKVGHYCRYGPYLIRYLPKKALYIAKLRDLNKPYKRLPNGKYKIDTEWRVTIWDVHGFFQGSFQKALDEWGIGTPDQRAIIERGKRERDSFDSWAVDDITAYNDTENVLLVELINKVRGALRGLDLHLSRWDGAGKIAATMLKKELPKDYIKAIPVPEEIETIGHYAFAGGRIECIQHGTHNNAVYRYDVNSAYPAAMTLIPDLQQGEWRRWNGQPTYQNFGLYRVSWHHDVPHAEQLPFYPFFWRDLRGYIYFPSFGENWVWGCELNAALDCGVPIDIRVHEGWEFEPTTDDKPFAFIGRYYAERSDIKRRIKAGQASAEDAGKSLAIKLGLNSMYGKTAQKVGYDRETGQRPPYYNVLIAGWITAYTRAALFRAAWEVRENIIALATDGILSTAPIASIADGNGLGGWEAETLTGLQIVQSGVYWTRNSEGRWKEYSRGFDRSDDARIRRERVAEAWARGERALPFTLRRFVASKFASMTDDRWSLHCAWVAEERELQLHDPGEKRDLIAVGAKRELHKRLYRTLPSYSPALDYGELALSQPCRTPWESETLPGIVEDEDDETLIDD